MLEKGISAHKIQDLRYGGDATISRNIIESLSAT